MSSKKQDRVELMRDLICGIVANNQFRLKASGVEYVCYAENITSTLHGTISLRFYVDKVIECERKKNSRDTKRKRKG